jgi:three-Cys-motif partner protein
MLLAALKSKKSARVEVVLVERVKSDFDDLALVTEEYRQKGVVAAALHGDVRDHFDSIVRQASGVPLFLFLDPCGANVPYGTLEHILGTDRRERRPATEVLLNISADLTRRVAGALNKGQNDHPSITLLDAMCGGQWWQQVALDAHKSAVDGTWESAAEAVVTEYARRIGEAVAMRAVVVPVRRQMHHQPVYHLVFLTRAEHGLWVFGDALASARQTWMRLLGPDEQEAEGMLFNAVEEQIQGEHERGVKHIQQNMLDLVGRRGRVKLVDHTLSIFGSTYGVVSEKVVRQAVRALQKAGTIQLDAKPRQVRDWQIWR